MNVIFIDTVHDYLKEQLEALGFQCDDHTSTPKEEVEAILGRYDGIVIRSRMPMNEMTLRKATRLKFIARSGAGMENIDTTYCERQNIALFNAPEGNRDAVGEQAVGMLLSLFNNLRRGDREVRKGIWDREGNRGHEIGGKTVGIIGYGNNGGAFAKKLSGFDCTVLAYDKYKSGFSDEYAQEATMDTIFDEADILSFHIPQTEETLYLFDEAYMDRFNRPIYVINLARGKIIQTEALVAGLKSGKILGACLDVLEYEKASFEQLDAQGLPASFQYLLQSEKVELTPHVGGWTHESYFKLSKVLAEKVKAWYAEKTA